MSRFNTFTRCVQALIVVISSSLLSSETDAATLDGIYIGHFTGSTKGSFGMVIQDHGALLAFADAETGVGTIIERIQLGTDGSFHTYSRAVGGLVRGVVSSGIVQGSYGSDAFPGQFEGIRSDGVGSNGVGSGGLVTTSNPQGFYDGRFDVRLTEPAQSEAVGRLIALIGHDGVGFVLLHDSTVINSGPPSDDEDSPPANPFTGLIGLFRELSSSTGGTTVGGIIELDSNGFFEFVLPRGLKVDGYVDAEAGAALGMIALDSKQFTGSGTWAVQRRQFVPAAASPRIPRLADLEGDGHDEIIWRHALKDEHRAFSQRVGSSSSQTIPFEPFARLHGAADFDGDGDDDLLWRDFDGGLVVQSRIHNGFGYDREFFDGDIVRGLELVTTGDFNCDGVAQLLWSDAETSQYFISSVDPMTLTQWRTNLTDSENVIGAADFNKNGCDDIVSYSPGSRRLQIRSAKWGTKPLVSHQAPQASARQEIGIGDFNGDAKPDVIWHDKVTGTVTIWLMKRTRVGKVIELNNAVSPEFQLAAIGDIYRSGKDAVVARSLRTGENSAVSLKFKDIEFAPLRGMANTDWLVVQF